MQGPTDVDNYCLNYGHLSAANLASPTDTVPVWPATRRRITHFSSLEYDLPPSHLGHPSNGETLRKVLVVVTIERWNTRLTSESKYDELLIPLPLHGQDLR